MFLDNRVGKLRELLDIFNGQSVKLAAFSILDSADHAVIRLLTSRSELTRRLLQRHEIPFSESDVLIVELGWPADDELSFAKPCFARN